MNDLNLRNLIRAEMDRCGFNLAAANLAANWPYYTPKERRRKALAWAAFIPGMDLTFAAWNVSKYVS